MSDTFDNLILKEKVDLSHMDIRKILVVSDSHGKNENLKKVMKKLDRYVDLVIHLGDSTGFPEDIACYTTKPIIMIKGNCDYYGGYPKNTILKIKGHKFLLMHGTNFYGEATLDEMQSTAMNNDADVLLVGHTHVPLVHDEGEWGVSVANPGSISLPRQYPRQPSYLVINVKKDETLEFVPVLLQ